MSRFVAPLFAAMGMMALLGGSPPHGESRAGDPPAAKKQTLVMLVRVAPTLSRERIATTLQQGLKVAKCTTGKIDIEPIPGELFRILKKEDQNSVVGGVGGSSKISVRQMPDLANAWMFSVNEPLKVIGDIDVEMEVEQNQERSNKKETYQPGSFAKDRFYQMSVKPVSYVLRLEKNMRPIRFTARILDLKDKTSKAEASTGQFSADNRHYMISLVDFSGSRDALFKAIKKDKDEKNLVPDPFDDLEPASDLTVAFASWGSVFSRPNTRFGQFHYTAEAGSAGNRKDIVRVWIFFPLTEKQARDELKKYENLNGVEVTTAIHKSNPSYANMDKDLVLDPKMTPRWIELPLDGDPEKYSGRFSRKMRVEDWRSIQAAYPKVSQLVVWEFSNKGVIEHSAVPVFNKKKDRDVLVFDEELDNWSRELQAFTTEKKTPSK